MSTALVIQLKEKVHLAIQDRGHVLHHRPRQLSLVGQKDCHPQRRINLYREEVPLVLFSVLNMNFDFIHNVQGHSIRIYKEADSVNVYGCRIDNRSFDYLLRKATSVSDVKPEKK